MLLFCMSQVNSIISLGMLAVLAAGRVSGCSPAQSQTNTAKTATVSPPFTNTPMDKFQKPAAAELKQKLTPLPYTVTQRAGTEPSFRNELWHNHKPAIYVNVA